MNPYCSFVFEHGRVKQGQRKKSSPSFHAIAHCTFTNCPCHVQISIYDKSKTKSTKIYAKVCLLLMGYVINFFFIQVYFINTQIKHSKTERRARPIKGSERVALRTKLTNIKPSCIQNMQIFQLPKEQFLSGNLTEVEYCF